MLQVCSADSSQCVGDFLHRGDFIIRTKEDLSLWERDLREEGKIIIMGAIIYC